MLLAEGCTRGEAIAEARGEALEQASLGLLGAGRRRGGQGHGRTLALPRDCRSGLGNGYVHDGDVMNARGGEYEAMPDGVLKRQAFPEMEYDANRVEHAAGGEHERH